MSVENRKQMMADTGRLLKVTERILEEYEQVKHKAEAVYAALGALMDDAYEDLEKERSAIDSDQKIEDEMLIEEIQPAFVQSDIEEDPIGCLDEFYEAVRDRITIDHSVDADTLIESLVRVHFSGSGTKEGEFVRGDVVFSKIMNLTVSVGQKQVSGKYQVNWIDHGVPKESMVEPSDLTLIMKGPKNMHL